MTANSSTNCHRCVCAVGPHQTSSSQQERRRAVGDLRALEPRREPPADRRRPRPGADEPDAEQEHEPDPDERPAAVAEEAVRISQASAAAGRTDSVWTSLSTT